MGMGVLKLTGVSAVVRLTCG
eukprot:COSAG01_NODE_70854_length_257_cov_1.208861_2_plen_20_part_01